MKRVLVSVIIASLLLTTIVSAQYGSSTRTRIQSANVTVADLEDSD